MNCRCTLVAALDGVEDSAQERFSRLPKGMTYEQWKRGKVISVRGHEGETDYVFSEHVFERAQERGVELNQVVDAIVNPLFVSEIKHDGKNLPSVNYIGREAMKNLTNLYEEELVSNLEKPIAACIMLLGVAAVALIVPIA